MAGLPADAELLQLNMPAVGLTLTADHTQKLIVDGINGQTFQLQFGASGSPTGDITIGATAADSASAIQTALRGLSGSGSLQVNAGTSAGEYQVTGFTSPQDGLRLVSGTPVSVVSTTSQELFLDGLESAGDGAEINLRFGDGGAPSQPITIVFDADGRVATSATANAIQANLRELLGDPTLKVVFNSDNDNYVVSGLASTTSGLQLDNSNHTAVTARSTATRLLKVIGNPDQQFRLKFGNGGTASQSIAIGANNGITSSNIQIALRNLIGEGSLTVQHDATADAYAISGLAAPSRGPAER